jgi:hypothetical protein
MTLGFILDMLEEFGGGHLGAPPHPAYNLATQHPGFENLV